MVVALVVLVTGSLWLARGGLSKGYPLYAKFPWGAGLKQGQPVLLVGVNVGYVEKVELKQDGTLITTLRINDEYKVPRGTKATVVANGIFGDMAIALTPTRPNPASIPEGDTLPVGPTAPGLAQLTSKADSVATAANAIVTEMQRQLVAAGGIADMRRTMAGTNRLVAQLNSIAAEQSRQLSATMSSIRRTAEAVDPAVVDSTVRNLRATSANMVALSNDLNRTTTQLNTLLAKVDTGGGTVPKLLNDPSVYNDVHRLLNRIDSLTLDFQKNPRKYINLEIF